MPNGCEVIYDLFSSTTHIRNLTNHPSTQPMSSIINTEKNIRRWSCSAAAGVILFASIILSGSWAGGQTLELRFLFDDAGPGTTTTSDASGALGTGVTLYMETAVAGTATNLHGAANSGVQGQGRGLDF